MKINFVFILIVFVLLVQCQKIKTTQSVTSNIYTVSDNFIQSINYILPLKDNCMLLFIHSMDDNNGSNNKLIITKLDVNQKKIWSKEYFDIGIDLKINPSSDGGVLVLSKHNQMILSKFNGDGDMVFKNQFVRNNERIYYKPYEDINGDIIVVESKYFFYDHQNILIFNNNGVLQNNKTRKINDSQLGAQISSFQIGKVIHPDTILFVGYDNKNIFVPNNNPNLFIAKLSFKLNKLSTKKVKILDSGNIVNFNYVRNLHTIGTQDKHMVIATEQRDSNNNTKSHIYKINENFNKVWEKDLIIGNQSTVTNSLTLCNDGSYLISGYCKSIYMNIIQPFACKVNSQGNIIWSQVYNMPLSSQFIYGFQLNTTHIFFGGNTVSFGKGKTAEDAFLFKTNNQGIFN